MADIPYVKRKIGPRYLVWFQNSNLYFQLEEPAWFAFQKIARGQQAEAIAPKLELRYGWTPEESLTFVNDIGLRVEEMNRPVAGDADPKPGFDAAAQHVFTSYSSYHYRLGSRVIRFFYETSWLERYVHPLISHLETDGNEGEDFLFELFSFQNQVVFRFENQVKGMWGKDESHLVKGMIFLELINVLHHKKKEDWLMTVHASAITNGHKTILFSAAPGSGKTTLAALLQARGYHLISDDFVPFDKYTMNAYPFPIAMSVKEGAMEVLASHYPDLAGKQLRHVAPNKKVRYLPIENDLMQLVFPVQEIVFVKYNPAIDFQLDKLDFFEALRLLLEQVWVPPTPANVEILFERVENLRFYQLNYSDNSKALEAIKEMFDHD
ncbi:phosphoenolpyruvate carboxykinase (ATP) [Sunxiuqinia dokdonensis]|uniref:HPr kinase n=1 Tax=Sunxiuqinia dokdonensis TaxID=1409788 RepID=A0A0L8V857_9BACT|nr:hypothetical protein [Sunxiuqinia dokdonensis]KOH44640.1 hypothetical protein NC99_25480 [Sunxiuqinia dokdonensis]